MKSPLGTTYTLLVNGGDRVVTTSTVRRQVRSSVSEDDVDDLGVTVARRRTL